IHRKPSGVANWTGGGDLAADSLGKLFCNFDVFLFFDSPSHSHDDFGLREIHGLLGFLEDFLGLISDETVGNVYIHRLDRSSAGPYLNLIPAESTILKGNKPRRIRGEAYVSGELALEHLAGEKQPVTLFLVANAVGDRGPLHRCGELRNEVPHRVWM